MAETEPLDRDSRARASPYRKWSETVNVPYNRQTLDTPNPLARFAHKRRIAIALSAASALATNAGTVLDFGCGPGIFIHELQKLRPDLSLIGFDPYTDQNSIDLTVVDSMDRVQDASVDVVTALETCEHLDDSELREFIDQSHRVLSHGGKVLVSVPIIGGPGLLAKELNRAVLFHQRSDYSLRELLAATFLAHPAPRGDVKNTHKGFDFRQFHRRLAESFVQCDGWFAPFTALPWPLNSQAFSTWARRVEQS